MDNTDKFSGKAKIYDKARPNYATQLIEYLTEKFSTNITIAQILVRVRESLQKNF